MARRDYSRPWIAFFGPQGPYEVLRGLKKSLGALEGPQGPYKALKGLIKSLGALEGP